MKKHSKKKVMIIVGSTRPSRVGRTITDWFYNTVIQNESVEYEIIDLADWKLPLLNESAPAKLNMYQHEHTKSWSQKIGQADGYIIVMPEYNHGYSAVLKNALDYLYHEWSNKPVAFIGYGVDGAQSAIRQLREVATELGMQPLEQTVNIPLYSGVVDENHQVSRPHEVLKSYHDVAMKLAGAMSNAVDGGDNRAK